jgi:hypothetical protein
MHGPHTSTSRPLKTCCLQVHSSLALLPLQSSFAMFLPPNIFRHRATYLGFRPSSRPHQRRPVCEEFHFLAAPSSGFLNLSTVFSTSGLTGLFHPATTYRVHPVQGLLPPCSRFLSSRNALPLAVPQTTLTDRNRLPRQSVATSRLRSTRRCVATDWDQPPGSSLPSSGSRLLQVLPSHRQR